MKSKAQLPGLDQTIFYTLEKAIKSYRQFAQRNIRAQGVPITIDQWLVLKTIVDQPELSQKEIAERVFKDYASITRMVELLVRRGYLLRSPHEQDRRQHKLKLTESGRAIYDRLVPIVLRNREIALEGLENENIQHLHQLLQRITNNCQ